MFANQNLRISIGHPLLNKIRSKGKNRLIPFRKVHLGLRHVRKIHKLISRKDLRCVFHQFPNLPLHKFRPKQIHHSCHQPILRQQGKVSGLFPLKTKDIFRHHFEKPSTTTTTTITTVPVVALAETERPTPIKPYLPLIKEKTIEKHLGQKSTLKCKSPRPGTALSRSTHSLGAELYPGTQHRPLQVRLILSNPINVMH